MALGLSAEVAAPSSLGVFFMLASYLNLNDPDWLLWSTAYALGAFISLWTAWRGASGGGQGLHKDASRTRRVVAMTYGAACLGLAWHSAFLAPRGESLDITDGIIVAFLSSEVAREAGGALIMAQAMALCAFIEPSTTAAAESTGGAVVGVMSVTVAAVAIVLGVFLPGYLQRAGIAVPAHCGGD